MKLSPCTNKALEI